MAGDTIDRPENRPTGRRPSGTGSATAVVDGYLADLAGRLGGPRRYRAQVIDELRDGLWEATRANGGTDVGAARAAVAQFGDPGEVAVGFAEEAAAAQARRTAYAFVATGPLVGVWWLLTLAAPGWSPADPASLVRAIPAVPLVALAALAAVTAIAATGRLSRRLPVTSRHALGAAAVTAGACIAGDLTVLGALAARAATAPATLPWILAAVAVAGSVARLAYARRALATCRHTRRVLT